MPDSELISNLGAVVLCGGGSKRMGTAKSQLVFQGQTFLDRVLSRVSSAARPVVLASGSGDPPDSTYKQAILVADQFIDQGPLEGIRVGLKELADEVEFAFVTGCDVPLLEPGIIGRLYREIGSHQAVVPVQGRRVFGLTAIYRTDITEQLSRLIEQKILRVVDLVEQLDTCKLDVECLKSADPELNSLVNINDWEQYAHLLRRFNENTPGS